MAQNNSTNPVDERGIRLRFQLDSQSKLLKIFLRKK